MTNFVTNPGTGGSTFASDTISAVEYPLAKSAWGAAGAVNQTSTTAPLPVAPSAANFIFSTANSTTTQLAAAATFTGTIETAQSQPAISLLMVSDQSMTITIKQYIDSGGTKAVPDIVFTVPASSGFSYSVPLNGNYVSVSAKNNGGATTTTFQLDTAYGTISAADQRGQLPVSLPQNTPTKVPVTYYAVAAAAGATGVETAISLTKALGTAATGTGSSFVITSGKTFRITSITVATRGNATATTQTTTFNLRVNTAGAVTTTSTPVIFAARSATPATASAWDRAIFPIPDGLDIAGNGTVQFGITAAATFTTNAPTWDVVISGYEY